MNAVKVLLIEDNLSLASIIKIMMEGEGIEIDHCDDGLRGVKLFEKNPDYDLVITDIKLPSLNGYEVFENIKKINEEVPVIIITAFGNIPDAVKAIKAGAFDYIAKPFDNDEFLLTVKKAIDFRKIRIENVSLKNFVRSSVKPEIIGVSEKIKDILKVIDKIAPTDGTVIIMGESGVGKELFAREIHVRSKRADKPFLSINCSAIPENLFESELFGYKKGAFTGAESDKKGKIQMADGGTIFLDEIGEIPYHIQAKLLRFLQEGEIEQLGSSRPIKVDVRVLSATNRNLPELIKDGKFREDLFYRLNVFPINIPPLRERKEDIPYLIKHFMKKYGFKDIEITEKAMAKLINYEWYGNVRELENIVYRLCVMARSRVIDVVDLPQEINNIDRKSFDISLPEEGLNLEDLEKNIILLSLKKFKGNKSKTAEYLGLPRHVLLYRLEKYGLE